MLSPFVYWAQTESNITLKVDLKEVKDPNVVLEKERLNFEACGIGAKGPHKYEFTLNLYLPIVPEESQYRVVDRQVDFTLKKEKNNWWPRLTNQPQKPVWLKIDFDRWKSEDDVDEENEKRNIMNDYPNMYNTLRKEELGYRKEDMKKVYLVIYNLFQFIGFLYILTVMGIRYFRDGPASMEGTYEAVGPALKFCQLIQFLEVMHPMFGYTKGGVITPLIQVGGRGIVLFCLIEMEPRMHTKPVIFYLFFIWSLVEIFRYPYYVTQVYNYDIGFLTWLRYTIWIPLYPLGFLCEGIVILRDIPYFEETQRFTVSLPNSWNFAFHFPTVMRIYLMILFLPAMYAMMMHMYRARVKKLGPQSWNSKMD